MLAEQQTVQISCYEPCQWKVCNGYTIASHVFTLGNPIDELSKPISLLLKYRSPNPRNVSKETIVWVVLILSVMLRKRSFPSRYSPAGVLKNPKGSGAVIMPYNSPTQTTRLWAYQSARFFCLAISNLSLVCWFYGFHTAHAQTELARIDPNLPSANSTDQSDKPILAVERAWMDTRPRFINSKAKNSSISDNGTLVPLSAIPKDRSSLPPTTSLLTPLPYYTNSFDRSLFKNASQYCHHRLLFEDYWRERYGISRGCLPGSPAIGATNLFLGQTLLLPIQAAKAILLKLITSGDAAP